MYKRNDQLAAATPRPDVGSLVQHVPNIYASLHQVAGRMGFGPAMQRQDYYVIDCETTGVNPHIDSVWQLGGIHVIGGVVVEVFNRVVQIAREEYDKCPPEIREKIHLNWETIVEKGRPAAEVMREFLQFQGKCPECPVIGQNLRSFDIPMLLEMWRDCGLPGEFPIQLTRCIDLGLIVKAAQVQNYMQSFETPADFFTRVSQWRLRGVRWSLEYIAKQLSLDVDQFALHDAVVDCLTLSQLITYLTKAVAPPA